MSIEKREQIDRDYGKPYDGCFWDCEYHLGANGCKRRKDDPEIRDDFCVGGHVCAVEWPQARTCATCYNRDRKSKIVCVYGGNW